MSSFDYDLFVIGAGSGGVRAARLAAQTGARVAIAEEYRVGGTCVIRGCVPKKFMVYASEFPEEIALAQGYGWTAELGTFDWARFKATKDAEISRLSGIYAANLAKAGVQLINARAQFVDSHTLELPSQGRRLTAAKILIATGGRPVVPTALPGHEHGLTSNEVFHLEQAPNSILVIGGGYIAIEFACVFKGLGVETTLAYRGPKLLRGFDEEVREHVTEAVVENGLHLRLNAEPMGIDKTDAGLVCHFAHGDDLTVEAVLFATGRAPYVEGLGLEHAGVALTPKGAIAVDAFSRTSTPHIFAVGDVTDRINLTPVAIREAAAFAATEFQDKPTRFDHLDVASAVFSQPEVATVGLNEEEAVERFGEVEIFVTRFRPMKSLFAGKPDRVLMKLVVQRATDKVVGCHMVGPGAAEIIQMAAIAVKAGLTKRDWDETCAVHPTMAEEFVTLKDARPGRSEIKA